MLVLLGSTSGFSFELNEDLLGLPEVPYMVGQALSPEDVAAKRCVKTENGPTVCPIATASTRGFGFMIQETDGQARVTAVMSYWKCEPERCSAELKTTVEELTKRLGAEPGRLGETPIWRDREKRHRDLVVQQLGSTMVSIVLLESD